MGNPYAFVGNNPWTYLDPYGEGTMAQTDQIFLTAAESIKQYGNRTALGKILRSLGLLVVFVEFCVH